jgi:hypothetical protein
LAERGVSVSTVSGSGLPVAWAGVDALRVIEYEDEAFVTLDELIVTVKCPPHMGGVRAILKSMEIRDSLQRMLEDLDGRDEEIRIGIFWRRIV